MERELLDAFLGGDQPAFESLVLMYRRPAVLFALRLTRELAAAEDAVQEAFAWLWAHPERIRPGSSFKALLYTLVRRRCMDWFRALRRTVPLEEGMPDARVYAPEAVFARERALALYEALDGIAPRYARVIHLLDIEGFTLRETADILGTTVGAVKTAHHRAKDALRVRLRMEGLE